MNQRFISNLNEAYSPKKFDTDPKKLMLDIFQETRIKDHILCIDLDGTLTPYLIGRRPHRNIQFRPHYRFFINTRKQNMRLVLAFKNVDF